MKPLVEAQTRIELALCAWEAHVLPLNYWAIPKTKLGKLIPCTVIVQYGTVWHSVLFSYFTLSRWVPCRYHHYCPH